MRKVIIALAGLALLSLAGTAHAGLGKWFKKEVVGTIAGTHKVRPRLGVRVSHNGKNILRAQTSRPIQRIRQLATGDFDGLVRKAFLRGISIRHNGRYIRISTGQPSKRLAQAYCVAMTGNFAACAPDVMARERGRFQRAVNDWRSGALTAADHQTANLLRRIAHQRSSF